MLHDLVLTRSVHTLLGLCFVLSLLGCPPGSDGVQLPSCELDESLAENSLSATVDGASWQASSTGYQLLATGFLASFAVDAQNTLSFRLVESTEFYIDDAGSLATGTGDDIQYLLEQGDLPASFELGETADEGADVTLGRDGSTLHTGPGDGGYLELVVQDAGVLRGCFSFHAREQSGSGEVNVAGGSFALTAL